MLVMKAWRPIASKITVSSSLPRIVRVTYSTDAKTYDFIKVSSPKPGVGLSKPSQLTSFDSTAAYH